MKGHVIENVPVVAMLFVMELAARFAAAITAGSGNMVQSIDNVKVYKGIQLFNITTHGDWIQLDAIKDVAPPKNVQVDFRDANNRLNYRFSEKTGPALPLTKFSRNPVDFGSEPWNWDIDLIYQERMILFHAGVFQGISALKTIDANGMRVALSPKVIEYEPKTLWISDTVLIDSGGQAIALWEWYFHEKHVLPTGIKSIRIYQLGHARRPLEAYIRILEDTSNHAYFDAWIVDENQDIVVEIKQSEMTKLLSSWIPEERKRHPVKTSRKDAQDASLLVNITGNPGETHIQEILYASINDSPENNPIAPVYDPALEILRQIKNVHISNLTMQMRRNTLFCSCLSRFVVNMSSW